MHKISALSVLTGIGCTLTLSGIAHADYSGLQVVNHTTVNIGGTNHDVWRVYATFSNAGDQLVSVAGSANLGDLILESRNANDDGAGSAFYNNAFGGALAPSAAAIGSDPNAAWDTFATIGVSVSDQAPFGDTTTLAPLTPSIAGTTYIVSDGGWYAPPTILTPAEINNPQTLAGFAGDGDGALRVLMMQLTTVAGGNVRGTVAISYRLDGALAGDPGITIGGQTFNSFPAPGALALLGLAGLCGTRRRR
jgi:hypothetical protein